MSFLRMITYMRNTELRSSFVRSARLATATYGHVARGMGRSLASLDKWRAGRLPVTRDAARRLASYLRRRAELFIAAADELERTLDQEEGLTNGTT